MLAAPEGDSMAVGKHTGLRLAKETRWPTEKTCLRLRWRLNGIPNRKGGFEAREGDTIGARNNWQARGSLMENLQIADRGSDPSAIRRAAQILGLDSWITTLEQGYDTRLGVSGMRLSSGQAQHLAILRALLKRPSLLLLDEVTSAMDIESEKNVLQGIRRLRPKGCLTVITTHRLAITLQGWISRVVVLENGQITNLKNGKSAEIAKFSQIQSEIYKKGDLLKLKNH